MRNLIFVIILSSFFSSNCQTNTAVHLSFNLDLGKENYKSEKIKNKEGILHFYINENHFRTLSKNPDVKEFDSKELIRAKLTARNNDKNCK